LEAWILRGSAIEFDEDLAAEPHSDEAPPASSPKQRVVMKRVAPGEPVIDLSPPPLTSWFFFDFDILGHLD
jgi:hypothetical protein